MRIYTIGHSNLSLSDFTKLLKKYKIKYLVDVRTNPYSKYARWSKKDRIEDELTKYKIDYFYFGDRLGGLPFEKMTDFYDRERNPLFVVAIQELIDLANTKRTAIMCSEARPDKCHRKNILGRHLVNRGWEVIHIMRDGTSEIQQPMLL